MKGALTLIILGTIYFGGLQVAADPIIETSQETFLAKVSEVRANLPHDRYGFRGSLAFPFKKSPSGQLRIVNSTNSAADGFDCTEAAVQAYDEFYKAGFPVRLVEGIDELKIWNRSHFYIEVNVEGKWRIVDFTPPYDELFQNRELAHKRLFTHTAIEKTRFQQQGGITLQHGLFPYAYERNASGAWSSRIGLESGPVDSLAMAGIAMRQNTAGQKPAVFFQFRYELIHIDEAYFRSRNASSTSERFLRPYSVQIRVEWNGYMEWLNDYRARLAKHVIPFSVSASTKDLTEAFDQMVRDGVIHITPNKNHTGIPPEFGKETEMKEALVRFAHNALSNIMAPILDEP